MEFRRPDRCRSSSSTRSRSVSRPSRTAICPSPSSMSGWPGLTASCRTTGDPSAAFDRGIVVSATPYGVLARVAQHTLALMLALARNLVPSHQSVLDGTVKIDMQPEYAKERPLAFNWPQIPDIGSLFDK